MYQSIDSQGWTDSHVVIGYNRNTQRQFTQWNYISSKMNPADHASRSSSGSNSKHLDLWLNGP